MVRCDDNSGEAGGESSRIRAEALRLAVGHRKRAAHVYIEVVDTGSSTRVNTDECASDAVRC